MTKYKATINIDRDVWDKFRSVCDRHETTATAEITAFIEAFCIEKEYDVETDWETMPVAVRSIREDLFAEMERYIDHKFDLRMEQLKTNEKTDEKTDVETDAATDEKTDEKTDVKTDNKTDGKTDNRTDREVIGNIEGFEFDSKGRQLWSDADIAEELNLTKATVNRYRTGKRKTPAEVSNHWEVSTENPHRWIYKK